MSWQDVYEYYELTNVSRRASMYSNRGVKTFICAPCHGRMWIIAGLEKGRLLNDDTSQMPPSIASCDRLWLNIIEHNNIVKRRIPTHRQQSNLADTAICGVETEALEADGATRCANEASGFEGRIVLLVFCYRPDFKTGRETC